VSMDGMKPRVAWTLRPWMGLATAAVLLHTACMPPAAQGPAARSLRAAPAAAATAVDCDQTTGYDVIIVGAGLSGLTASKELRRGGRDKVLILEATDRIGGRASTLKQGPPIDLGGAWLHGVSVNPLTGLADSMGMERVTSNLLGPIFVDDGTQVTALEGAAYQKYEGLEEDFVQKLVESSAIQKALKECKDSEEVSARLRTARMPVQEQLCQELKKKANDKSSDYLPTDPQFRSLLAGNLGPLESAVEIDQVSSVEAIAFEAGDDDLLKEGIGTFVERLGQSEPVCLNSPVTKITYREDGVVLEVKNGKRYEARKALVTVSTGALQKKRIQFDPELPAKKREAIAGLPMGHMQKVIVDFKAQGIRLGDTPNDSWVLYQSPSREVMAFVIKPLGTNIAIGFYGGQQAQAFEGQCESAMVDKDKALPPQRQPCDEAAVQRTRAALIRIYGAPDNDIGKAVDAADIYVTRWSLDPWSAGAYSAARPGAWVMRDEMAKPISFYELDKGGAEQPRGVNRVYFGGEAAGRAMYNGSFAGAYEAGLFNARQLLQNLAEEDGTRRVVPRRKLLPLGY
jgi:monoamine oxidase